MRIFAVLLLITLTAGSYSQILPGMNREEVKKYMAGSFRDFVLRVPPNADELDFLKYEHKSGDMTLLVFVNKEGVCRFTRMMIDIDYLDETIDDYNTGFEPSGEMKWRTTKKEEEFIVSIDAAEWMFTVTVRPLKDIPE